MRRRPVIGIIAFTLSLFFPWPCPAMDLTQAEREYLHELGRITMCVDPDWEPYELMDEYGNFTGIAADLVALVSKRLEVPFFIVPTADWDESLEVSKQGGCMILPFLNQTSAREEWLTFTEPLFTNPNVFITRNEHDYVSDPAELVDRTVVLPHGTSMEEFLRRDYPNLKIITVDDENECYRMVSSGEADMTLRSLTIAAYTIRKDGWFNLKVAGQPPQDHYINRLRMGVLKDMPELRHILNKAIATITPRERDRILNKHVNITVETPFDYSLIYRISGGLAFLVSIVAAWNYRLKKINEERRLLLDNIRTQVWYITGEYQYGAVNKAHAQFFGMKVGELAFRNMYDVFSKEFVDAWRPNNRKAFESADPFITEEWVPDASDEKRLLSIQRSPRIRSDGSVEYIVCSAEDITERKMAEELLRTMAETDELTGLWNRRFFMDALKREIERAMRYEQVFSLLMLDIDHFKRINDTHGHFGGDMCLVHFASMLREGLRQVDLPARLGGEEFAVILPQTDSEGAYAIAERFRMMTMKSPAPVGETRVSFSVSIGAASYRPEISSPSEILKMADEALYHAKNNGRNQTVQYGRIV